MNCGITLCSALRTLLFTYHNSFYKKKRDCANQRTLHLQEFTAIGTEGWRGRESESAQGLALGDALGGTRAGRSVLCSHV